MPTVLPVRPPVQKIPFRTKLAFVFVLSAAPTTYLVGALQKYADGVTAANNLGTPEIVQKLENEVLTQDNLLRQKMQLNVLPLIQIVLR